MSLHSLKGLVFLQVLNRVFDPLRESLDFFLAEMLSLVVNLEEIGDQKVIPVFGDWGRASGN
jgi:hypothetical protein